MANGVGDFEDASERREQLAELMECLISSDSFDQAQQCFEMAANLFPDHSDTYVRIGAAAMDKGDLENAEAAFRVACRLDTDCPDAYAGLARIAQLQGNIQRASEMYRKCLELDGSNLYALLGLFQVSREMKSFDAIIKHMERYLRSHSNDDSIQYCLATLYLNTGQLAASREMLMDLLKRHPEHENALSLLEEVEREFAVRNAR